MGSDYEATVLDDGRTYARHRRTGQIAGVVDWRWRSAQPGDVWTPKRGKSDKTINTYTVYGRSADMICTEVVVLQHHAADKAVMIRDASGARKVIKSRSLRQHWNPSVTRELGKEVKNG
ncbi:hypothetical protein UFOVP1328_13 [uncultured Caudovirales phage]|uniref:Uncharacterized protein n=1 Tax=uncultured Caudovirales phage TaxID=2100421 RepID=A0A6J7XE56_9CAUD|nr:hypothetical protein UFOVP1084_3 [uncultured Caudovirales phage]CAB4199050.1 hypothetical protein UFOVP1328_13 [uncultured Caudovirales phage]CAB5228413.1 hypothetical protein UFOVP1532_44 [uncultured Caudovirales phage]